MQGLAVAIASARETPELPSPFTVFTRPWVPALNALPLATVVDMWMTAAFLDCDHEDTMSYLTADLLQRRLRGDGTDADDEGEGDSDSDGNLAHLDRPRRHIAPRNPRIANRLLVLVAYAK